MEKTETIIEDKMKALKIAQSHLRTYACVGGVICQGIDQHDLQSVINEIVDELMCE